MLAHARRSAIAIARPRPAGRPRSGVGHPAGRLDPVDLGHPHVHQDHVRIVPPGGGTWGRRRTAAERQLRKDLQTLKDRIEAH